MGTKSKGKVGFIFFNSVYFTNYSIYCLYSRAPTRVSGLLSNILIGLNPPETQTPRRTNPPERSSEASVIIASFDNNSLVVPFSLGPFMSNDYNPPIPNLLPPRESTPTPSEQPIALRTRSRTRSNDNPLPPPSPPQRFISIREFLESSLGSNFLNFEIFDRGLRPEEIDRATTVNFVSDSDQVCTICISNLSEWTRYVKTFV